MKTLAWFVATLVAVLASQGHARAQSVTRRPVPAGAVTGLELALDGATSAPAGEPLRWFLTLYEVVGHDELRPARAGRVVVLAAHRPDAPIAELRTDRWGRAEVEIPTDEERRSFEVVLRARSGAVARDFRMDVSSEPTGRVEAIADRVTVQPGERITLLGRVLAGPSAEPSAGHPLTLRIADQDGRTLEPERSLRTGPAGEFLVDVVAPRGVTGLQLTATTRELWSRRVDVTVSTPEPPRFVLRALPRRRIVAPGEEVTIDVRARRPDGRPLPRVTIDVDGMASEEEDEIRTDEAGRATVTWRAPLQLDAATTRDVTFSVRAARPGLGEATAEVGVRVARGRSHVGVSVEGGALVPGLPARLYVRVVGADGQAAAGVPLRVENALFGALTGRTDGDGIAAFETSPEAHAGVEGRDRCGGATASAVRFTIGEGAQAVTIERCVPVDPDATVRVRPSELLVERGAEVEVELRAVPGAARAPIEVVLLRRDGDELAPVARQVVIGRDRASFTLPDQLVGEAVFRARPLIGRRLEPVRGGTAAIWVTPGPRMALTTEAGEGGHAVVRPERAVEGARSVVLAVPAGEVEPLLRRLRGAMLPPFLRSLPDPSRLSGDGLAGWLASRAPRDDAAPAVLRGRGRVVVLPAPEEPTGLGVLRDPVRARARFVRGRLALVLRTLEQRLAEAIPDRVSDVGLRSGGRWVFNREALEAVIGAHLLQSRVPMTLGGERMTLEDLLALDPNITFDNLARRVTRERLLRVLIALRSFVRRRQLDLWQGEGDVGLWLRLLPDATEISEADLYDGWGRLMAIRRAPGGRARFRFLTPLPDGWELVSAGPDGRFGSADDLVDPFARVLPSGSPYAEAVGEDQLLARLRRVEVSQATISAIGSILNVYWEVSEAGASLTAAQAWDAVPGPLEPLEPLDRFERFWTPVARGRAVLGGASRRREERLALGEEPRPWGLVTVGWTPRGWVDVSRARTRAGFPVIVTAHSPGLLHPGEPLVLPVVVARLPDGPDALVLEVAGDARVRAEVAEGGAAAPLRLGAGDAVEARLRVEGARPGRGSVRVVVSGAGRQRTLELPVEVRPEGLLRLQSAAAAASGPTSIPVELPRDARDAAGELILARPTAFEGDPTLARWVEDDPALLAWAVAVSGGEPSPALRRGLEAATARDGSVRGEEPALSTACAAVAWAASVEGVHWAPRATAAAAADEDLRGEGAEGLTAAVLAALSVAAAPDPDAPLARRIDEYRTRLRLSVRRERRRPAWLARGAAALLLADHRDVRGLTMLALLRDRLVPGFRGGLVVDVRVLPDEDDDEPPPPLERVPGREGAEQLAATAAAAIAAHQAGDRELARRLGRGLAARAHVAHAVGGEPLFWVLAARAFGVFGVGDEATVTVEEGGASRRVTLGDAVEVLPLAPPRPGRREVVRVTPAGEDGPVPLVQTALRYVRPAQARAGGTVAVAVEGDAGFVGDRAAFVATLSNESDAPIERPVLLIALPAGSMFDDTAIAALTRLAEVREVEPPDNRGVVRVRLAPLAPEAEVRVPLPLRWTAAGPRRGLALAAFPADRAWDLSVAAPLTFDVRFRQYR